MTHRLLVVDGYDAPARGRLRDAGCTLAGPLYAAMARDYAPEATIDIICPADSDVSLPSGTTLSSYDALLWTGSSLTIYEQIPEVARQIALAQAAFEAGVPSFGSCWALQIATVAAGGTCRLNPKGREFGITRKVTLTNAGRAHPMYAGKPSVFDAFTSHFDDVESLPSGAEVLATNRVTDVQAALITANNTPFWAVQYHPEYTLVEVAALTRFRAEGLIREGRFTDARDLADWTRSMESLQADPTQTGLAWRLGVDDDLIDTALRRLEFHNWFDAVLGRRAAA
ncbi:MAG: type 1 glutamine amidotransferase [Pseudomonadota bacterium]